MSRVHRLPNAVIFDVDGTLYSQRPLRRRMAQELLWHCLRKPVTGPRDVRILKTFRSIREKLPFLEAGGIADAQYALTGERLHLPPELIRSVVAEWMFRRPLVHLKACMYHGLETFLAFLQINKISVGIFSDYPAEAKLLSLGLKFEVVVDAEDPEVDRLKPHPRGLEVCAKRLGQRPADCLCLGDRDDRDGECARRIGMPYLLYDWRHADANRFQSYARLADRFQVNLPAS